MYKLPIKLKTFSIPYSLFYVTPPPPHPNLQDTTPHLKADFSLISDAVSILRLAESHHVLGLAGRHMVLLSTIFPCSV